MNFCSNCGKLVKFGRVPDDDNPRYLCEHCGAIHYENPKLVVGSLPRWEDKILLCKRAINPRKGLWTLPAGFLEMGESVEEGAARETLEEANARVEIVRLFSIYSLPQIGQVYLMFLADLKDLDFHPGKESLEVRLFRKEEVPLAQIAFTAIKFTLEKYFQNQENLNNEVYSGFHVK